MKTSSSIAFINLSKIDYFLEKVDGSDLETAAYYQQFVIQNILAEPTIALDIRQRTADRLNQINRLLALSRLDGEESY